MKYAALQVIMDRIQTATKKSAIIVERGKDERYKAFFADTVFGKRYLESPEEDFVGVFFGAKGEDDFRKLHHAYMRVPK